MHRSMRLFRPSSLPLSRATPAARPFLTSRPATSPITPVKPALNPLALAYLRRAYATSPSTDKTGKPIENSAGDNTNVDRQNTRSSAKEEIKGATRDVAEMISGRAAKAAERIMAADEVSSPHAQHGGVRDDFYTITSTLFLAVPKPALYFGLAGTLPYLGTALGTVFLARESSLASQGVNTLTGLDLNTALASLHTLEHVQITYGAIILSFLGAIHWGMEFAGLGGEQGWRRLALGTAPVLFAWPTVFFTHGVALAVQWAGFTGMWFLDQRASSNGWTTTWYSTYRFYLSIIVGFSIIGTFAGTGYYGAGAGAISDIKQPHLSHTTERVSTNKRLDRLAKAKAPPANSPDRSGRIEKSVDGEFELVDNEDGDSYTVLHKIGDDEEEEEEEEEGSGEEASEESGEEEGKDDEAGEVQSKEDMKKQNQEFQDKRDELQMDKAPGAMKDTAKDRTGKNANVPGGEEEKEGAKAAGGNRTEGGNYNKADDWKLDEKDQ